MIRFLRKYRLSGRRWGFGGGWTYKVGFQANKSWSDVVISLLFYELRFKRRASS